MSKYDHADAFERPGLKLAGSLNDLLTQVCLGVDTAAGADAWVLELDVEGWEVMVWSLEGNKAPYRMEVRERGRAAPAKVYQRAPTMERALESAAATIEQAIRRPVDRARLLAIAAGFDARESIR